MTIISKKAIIDDITILLTKFSKTDESRIDEDYLSFKIDEVRSDLIVQKFNATKEIDSAWLQDLGLVTFHTTNITDDSSVITCDCPVSKTTIPQVISLSYGNGNQDLGIYSVISACGKMIYYPFELSKWMYIPADHERAKFKYYSRINTALYVNKNVQKLRILAILQSPEEGFTKNSQPIASGNIVSGTIYIVKYGQVVYNGVTYQPNDTFTGTATTTFATSIGLVYLYSEAVAFTDLSAYPVGGDMARQIVIEICTKEFNIERQAIIDLQNDSKDDAEKQ